MTSLGCQFYDQTETGEQILMIFKSINGTSLIKSEEFEWIIKKNNEVFNKNYGGLYNSLSPRGFKG